MLRRTIYILIFCLLIYLANPVYSEVECKIVNITTALVTSNQIVIHWDTQGPCQIKKYTVEATHLNYKACPDLNLNNNEDSKKMPTNATMASFKNLEAYSTYEVIVKGTNELGVQIIRGSKNIETLSDHPMLAPKKGSASALTQAIHFTWEQIKSSLYDETTCRLQRGQSDGYYIELHGLSPWSPKGLIENKSTDYNEYYAKGLNYFSNYSLTVYVKNKNGSYNKNMPLTIRATTNPYPPEAPIEAKATPTSSETIYLSWKPAYPPTGEIAKYKYRYGPKTEPMDWKKVHEIVPDISNNLCAQKSKEMNFVCVQLAGLQPNTTYVFQAQTINYNKDKTSTKPGTWSEKFEATTDPVKVPNEETIILTPKKPVTDKPLPPFLPESTTTSTSTHLVMIIVSLVVIVILVIIVALLVYKIKMYKLKQKYESRQRRPRHGSIESNNSPPGFESLNVTALGSYYPSMATISYNVPSVAYQVRDIQSRKLPDPPSPTLLSEVEQELYENTTMSSLNATASPDLIANVDTFLRPQRTSTPRILMSPTRPQTECTDVDGYLCPTFCERPLEGLVPNSQKLNEQKTAPVIPTESYVSTLQLGKMNNDNTSLESSTTLHNADQRTRNPSGLNESHPLISLTTEPTETF